MKTFVQPQNVWNPQGRYSQAILSNPGKLLFIAGQTSIDEAGNLIGENDIVLQTKQVLENIRLILVEAGGSIEDIVKVTTYVTDARSLPSYYRVRREFFKREPPTSTTVVIAGLARKELLVQVEAIAIVDDKT
jgi:2-iminobutanoate/2-iminopropanoate deaminase